jgi:hypothetical protein
MLDEFSSAIREAIGPMIGCGVLIDRCCRLHSGVAVLRIEAADGYFVGALIACEVHDAIDMFR